jgi:hypothetical protein
MRLTITFLTLAVLGTSAAAQTVYHSTPDWVSADTQVSTGGALVDIDRDGWLDFVVANGNDMQQQSLVVYYNRGDGTFPSRPDWQSSDRRFNGHLDTADVNGDGWTDVAVALLGEFNITGPIARLYLNHEGVLSDRPEWEADIDGNAFGVAFGDMDNDGRPDLAVGTGWAYSPEHFFHNYVYRNIDGALEDVASWQSDDQFHYQGVLWTDADHDGWLDLVGASSRTYTRIYMNLGGMLETTASWRSADGNLQDAIMAVAGDVTGDGIRDLFVTDNTQLGGSGRFRQYNGRPDGPFETTYDWSYYDGYGSALALADVNADGLLDLATGAWWDNTRVFFNTGVGLPTSPDWNSAGTSVVEKIVFGDVDNSALRLGRDVFEPAGDEVLFHLSRQPIQQIIAVRVDDRALDPDEYVISREHGWLCAPAEANGEIEVEYLYSQSLDMAVTNWDSSRGNYLYYNQLLVNANCDRDEDVDLDDYACFHDCLTGPGAYSLDDTCGAFDFDIDGDVDMRDFMAVAELIAEP